TPSKLGRLQSREEQLEEMVSTVSQTFLGLTVNCARCHLHKYDPIPQADYYRIKAVFEGVDHGLQPRQHGTRRMLNAADDATWLASVTPLQQRLAEIDKSLQQVEKQLRDAKDVALLVTELQAQQAQLRGEQQQINRDLQTKYPVTLAFVGDRFQPAPTVLFMRGDVKQPGTLVTPGGLSALAQPSADFGLEANSSEAERRIKFAHWLTAPEHPFTARVMVNRVWQYHFGSGLVETSSDLGANGALPSHPALLDWLASEFHTSSGSVKGLQRLIVTSAAYRQAAVASSDDHALRALHAKGAAIDADNRLLWRYPARRLEGEVVRDAMLAMSGALNRELGGPSFRPFTVTQLNTNFYHLFDKDEPAFNRRSLYRIHAITGRSPLLDALDCPSPAVTIPRRRSTVTPLQALALMNDTFVLRQADKLAQRISAEHKQIDPQVTQAFEIVLARPPRANELAASRDVVQQHGLATLTWSLFNTSEFMYAR
ncbi:MAG TPA: DUF1553 domain-containing protein, partial [Pirellulaceae bacterium]|nr:DUF1553 domain-containing protein [Pirellulaceae bacterium]